MHESSGTELKSLSLSEHLTYKPFDSWKDILNFSSNLETQLQTSSMTLPLGWEYAHGIFTFSFWEQIHPKLPPLCLIPICQGYPAILALSALRTHPFLQNPASRNILFIDWPQALDPLLSSIKASWPTPVACVSLQNLQKGQYERTYKDLDQELAEHPVVVIESIEPRRFLLTFDCWEKVQCLDVWATCRQAEEVTSHDEEHMKQELLIHSGLFSYVSACAQKRDTKFFDAQKAIEVFFKYLSQNLATLLQNPDKNPTLWIAAHPKVLENLGKKLAQHKAELQTLAQNALNASHVRVLYPKTDTTSQKHASLCLAAISENSVCEHSRVPGFIAQKAIELLEQSHKHDSLQDWQSSYANAFRSAFAVVQERYREWTKLDITRAQERNFFRYVYRLAQHQGTLLPHSFTILLAAKATIDGNFAFEFVKECRKFPKNTQQKLPEIHLPLDAFFTQTIKMTVSQFETLQHMRDMRKRKLNVAKDHPRNSQHPQKNQQSWQTLYQHYSSTEIQEIKEQYKDASWTQNDVYCCSFPEEDIFMEDFVLSYRDQASSMVRSRETRVHELESTLGDGIDIRETLRNWHKNAIMVYEELNTGKADIGAVIFQFVAPEDEQAYNWESYWRAEIHDKTDLYFYATPYENNVIGPGIAKSEFGGFSCIPLPNHGSFLSYDPLFLQLARNRAERLILVSAAATAHKTLLYVSNYPVPERLRALLARSGKRILTMKLDALPLDKVRKLRTFHILADPRVRAYAAEYIRKE